MPHVCQHVHTSNAKRRRRVNPLRRDPTRAGRVRTALMKEIRARFEIIREKLLSLLFRENSFGLDLSSLPNRPTFAVNQSKAIPVENVSWAFLPTAAKIRAFKRWLGTLSSQMFGMEKDAKVEAYIQEGLRLGAGRAYEDTKATRKAVQEAEARARGLTSVEAQAQRLDFYTKDKESFLKSSFAQPVAKEKVELLASRTLDDLEGITRKMSTSIVRQLTDGLVQGKSPRDIGKAIDDEVDIGRSRADTIARTEISRAHADGQLMALKEMGVEEVGVMVEWLTAGDDAVCDLCAPLEKVVLKLEEAQGMLPRHPNCRCAWIPANVGEDQEESKKSKDEVEDAIDTSQERGSGGWGAGSRIGKDRPEDITRNRRQPVRLWEPIPYDPGWRVLRILELALNMRGRN